MSSAATAPAGLHKAAILMVVLGEDAASQLYRHLPPAEVEQITREITLLKSVDAETTLAVLEEFERLVATGDTLVQGGKEYANKLLVKAFGEEGAQGTAAPGIAHRGNERRQARLSAQSRSAAAGQVYRGRAPADHRADSGPSGGQAGLHAAHAYCPRNCVRRRSSAWRSCGSSPRKWRSAFRSSCTNAWKPSANRAGGPMPDCAAWPR
jgi:hypothetical protein